MFSVLTLRDHSNGRSLETTAAERWTAGSRIEWVSDVEVQVIQASASRLASGAFDRASLLDHCERMRMARFRREQDRTRFLVSHVLARTVLGQLLDEEPGSLRFSAGPYGKPQLLGGHKARFNLSHSHDRIVFAVSRAREVGVDVEKVSRVDVLGLAQRFFSSCEFRELAATPKEEQTMAFYRCWTRKESFVKALGKGLSYRLSSFTVEFGNSSGQLLLNSDEFGSSPNSWTILDLNTDEEYAGAVAVEGGSHRVGFWAI